MIRYIPIVFLLFYLILTELSFAFGPINYNLKYPIEFWSLLLAYKLCFFLGYTLILRTRKIIYLNKKIEAENSIIKKLPLFIALSIIASILSFKNDGSFLDKLNPIFWFTAALKGILIPGEVYTNKMVKVLSGENPNKLLNILLFLIAFSKILIAPFLIFYWRKINVRKKVFGILAILLPLLASMSFGTNKGVFDFVILICASLLLYFAHNKIHKGSYGFSEKKILLTTSLILVIGAFYFFGNAMSERGGSLQYIETQDPQGRISVSQKAIQKSQNNIYYYTYAWLSSYIVQGYYGFSLILEQPFQSTFGFGNSVFIRRNIESITGINLRKRTYQYRIDKYWGESSQWHSFYSYLANDFHFIGLGLVLILIGGHLAYIWIDFIQTGNPYTVVLLCLYVILIIFIPANNQIFGFLDGFSTFVWSNWLWIKSKKLYYG